LKDITKGEDIFHVVENCLRDNNLGLGFFSGILTDGVLAMTGKVN